MSEVMSSSEDPCFSMSNSGEEDPNFLRHELSALEDELGLLSKANRGVFVDQCECSRQVQEERVEMRDASEEMEASLTNLASEALDFAKKAGVILETHRRNRRAQRQLVQLLELLEIPQLMSTCVRSELHELAVSIAAFSVDLNRQPVEKTESSVKHILDCIVSEIDASANELRQKLAQQLREPLELAQFITMVVTMRRLDALHPARIGIEEDEKKKDLVLDALELELQQLFLDGRDECYPHAPQQESLGSLIESARSRFFEVATQFDALFCLDDDADEPRVSRRRASLLLSSWLSRHANEFRRDLCRVLNESAASSEDDAASLASLIQKTMFFGASLSRSGAELRPMLIEPLCDAVRQLTVVKWREIRAKILERPNHDSLNLFVDSLNSLRLCAPLAMETELSEFLSDAKSDAEKAVLADVRINASRMARLQSHPAHFEAAREETNKLEGAYKVLAHASECLAKIYDGDDNGSSE